MSRPPIHTVGVPAKVIGEAEGHTITVETTNSEMYKGVLVQSEDNMNIQLKKVSVTYSSGRTAQMENIYLRGHKIRFLQLPDMLKNSPTMFKPPGRGGGFGGRGRGGRGGRGGFGGRGRY